MESISRAQISRASIQKLHIAMRHLFIRGSYKPLGMSGEAMINALLALKPEIYGSINDPEKVELNGLLYIAQRLPQGIEECRYVKLIAREGFENSNFEPIIPSKRRRNCYRIDQDQMFIEMTRGRSDVYDVLTHLTFMYIEAEKIRKNAFDLRNRPTKAWEVLTEIVEAIKTKAPYNKEVGYTYLSSIIGRSYEETAEACEKFDKSEEVDSLFHIVYWLGRLSFEEYYEKQDREISFSFTLREKLGHHNHGEVWAKNVKNELFNHSLDQRPLHVISANMHSVMNSLYARAALGRKYYNTSLEDIAEELSLTDNSKLRKMVNDYALSHGMNYLKDFSGTNINVQIIDTSKIDKNTLPREIIVGKHWDDNPVLVVMDYAFGEQAYETMDELLKPSSSSGTKKKLPFKSVNIMGKAGILLGDKGDIMIATSHVFEGSADNYPFKNALKAKDFENSGLAVCEGTMITVLGTSLQNKDILKYFLESSWKAIGLEMEGAHYQKAIQAASMIRNSVSSSMKLRYAYYASDNPLETGSTLASGSLG
ncbi:MAG TPA: hypothetical protein PK147_12155, partial [Saprospiraceae bacterium]|nr:hypothetical protein [Saprospiraceae bacterium]